MTIELDPLGNACYAACEYCYLEPQRDAGNFGPRYDMDAMKDAIAAEVGSWQPEEGRSAFTLHGGDPLGLPIEDLEEILRWGHERWGTTSVQTIGSRITDAHIALFQRYNVHVGVSIDGPGEMNDLRRMRGSREDTRAATERTERAIESMLEAGVRVSVIIVLHRLNMARERRETFKGWIRHLDEIGVGGVRFHPMELDHRAEEWAPTVEEYAEFYRDLHAYMKRLPRLRIDILQDLRRLLEGDDSNVTCTWNACDPYTTPAVRAVDGAGERMNCGRTNKDGVAHEKAPTAGHERQLALYRTPQEHGGCRGCRWWFACKGQCPGEGLPAEDGQSDWRAKSSYCTLYKALFRTVEQELLDDGIVPLSLQSRRVELERLMDAHYQRGNRLTIRAGLELLEKGWAADESGGQHGDAPHGDSHGDHTDRG